MYRTVIAALSAFALGIAANAAAAQQLEVHRSGKTYHRAVCSKPTAPLVMRCHSEIVTDPQGNALLTPNAPGVTPSGFSPAQLQTAYTVDPAHGKATSIIAIVDAYGYARAEADLAVYRAKFGLPACTTDNGCFAKYNQDGEAGNYPKDNVGWSQETALDLDMASAMCPKCKIILVQAKTPSLTNLAAAVNTAANLGAVVISNSYGGDETGTTSFEPAYNHAGIAVTVSTGDNGYGVSFPATSPHVVAVGGTSLVLGVGGRVETAWDGAGSGCSKVYAKPAYQTDKGCKKRMVADVSAVADPNTGVAVYAPTSKTSSSWAVFGGTSASAPIIAGIYANQGTKKKSAKTLYANSDQLYDVTLGANGTCGTANAYFCKAGTGYDGPTGLGSPNGTGPF
jgi:subtilase family serine protease